MNQAVRGRCHIEILALWGFFMSTQGCSPAPRIGIAGQESPGGNQGGAAGQRQAPGGQAGGGTVIGGAGGQGSSSDAGRAGTPGDSSAPPPVSDAAAVDPGLGSDAGTAMPKPDAGIEPPPAVKDAALPETPPAPPAPPPPVTLKAAADAYAQGTGTDTTGQFVDNSKVNFGTATPLLVKWRPGMGEQYYWREAFLAFDIGVVPKITKATLTLTVATSDLNVPSGIDLRALDDVQWVESTLTWANRPAMAASLVRAVVPVGPKTQVTLDVTSYLSARQAAGARRVTFGVVQDEAVAYTNEGRVEIDAREAGDTGPRLDLRFGP